MLHKFELITSNVPNISREITVIAILSGVLSFKENFVCFEGKVLLHYIEVRNEFGLRDPF